MSRLKSYMIESLIYAVIGLGWTYLCYKAGQSNGLSVGQSREYEINRKRIKELEHLNWHLENQLKESENKINKEE